MQWADVVARPKRRVLRQFAGLWLVVMPSLAGLRVWRGQADHWALALAVAGVVVGGLGLLKPEAVRPIYSGWMLAAFPIGWTVSQLMLVALFYIVFTPVAWVFRLIRRDALGLRPREVTTYWTAKPRPDRAEDYFRQF
ncbi:MAG TPA: SxtJ family membrane protein [Vicinamibacterales bacterium]|nr:SxtJ family membrane protein [Vicinamibacterales bacterium]